MTDLEMAFYSLIIGAITGAIFYVSLWWTTQHLISSSQPIRWFFGGLLLRVSILLASFYLVSSNHWELWLIWLLGFIVLRQLVIRLALQVAQETHHAP
jgi:F1F0 ATPase subunit 2